MLFQEVMEWTHPSQTMNKAVFSKYIQMKGAKGENIEKILIIYLGRSLCCHQEVMEWTHPSQTMNKAVFSKYIQMKGAKRENIDHLFR